MNTTTSTALRTLLAGAVLSALALSFATVSRADDDTAPPQVIVKYADLDVSTAPGAAALYRRRWACACSDRWPQERLPAAGHRGRGGEGQ